MLSPRKTILSMYAWPASSVSPSTTEEVSGASVVSPPCSPPSVTALSGAVLTPGSVSPPGAGCSLAAGGSVVTGTPAPSPQEEKMSAKSTSTRQASIAKAQTKNSELLDFLFIV